MREENVLGNEKCRETGQRGNGGEGPQVRLAFVLAPDAERAQQAGLERVGGLVGARRAARGKRLLDRVVLREQQSRHAHSPSDNRELPRREVTAR